MCKNLQRLTCGWFSSYVTKVTVKMVPRDRIQPKNVAVLEIVVRLHEPDRAGAGPHDLDRGAAHATAPPIGGAALASHDEVREPAGGALDEGQPGVTFDDLDRDPGPVRGRERPR